MIHSTNPATNETLRTFEPLTHEALNARITLADAASRSYPRTSLDERAFWMRRLALLLEEDLEDLALLITTEMGKTLTSARAEVLKCAAVCRYYATNARTLLAPQQIATEHADAYVRYDPLGVVLAIMPWNFPLWQVFRFLAPALMGGNVGLLKHAPTVPQCALAIEALTRRAGFPRGVFQALLIETQQVEHVLSDERIAAVTLTGSEAAGRAVAAQAGWLIKKSVLELGGSDPFLVLPSADIDAAVAAAVTSRTLNCGQSCIAAKRFLIHTSIYDDFEQRFAAAMAALWVGDPLAPETDLGPLASPQALRKLADQVTAATIAGGRIITGGRHIPGPGNFFQPTVIADVPRNAAIAREEIFGPVALLFRVESLDDAIALANDTPFGLAATAFTQNPHEQQRLAAELHCGGVFFNTLVASDPRLPFGGIKKSGYGRELGAPGMHEFLNAKTIVLEGTQPSAQASLFDEKSFVSTPSDFPFRSVAEEPASPAAPEPQLNITPEPEPEPMATQPPPSPPEAPPQTKQDDDDPPPRPRRGSILGLD
jgi:succinate-semialdehyde dehydrogenase/glutarate-semialdehyde dehydrogenase